MVGHVETCIRCRKLFKRSMDAFHGACPPGGEIGVILRTSTKIPCSTEGARVGEKALSESSSFDIFEMAPMFPWNCMTNSRHHAKLFGFSTSFAFSRVFLVKRPINGRTCRNLHTLSKIIQTWHRCPPWTCPPACRFEGCPNIDHDQRRVFR